MSTALECKLPQQIGIYIFRHYPQQNKIHTQAMQQCQYLKKKNLPEQNSHFPVKILVYTKFGINYGALLPCLSANISILLQMDNPVQNHF